MAHRARSRWEAGPDTWEIGWLARALQGGCGGDSGGVQEAFLAGGLVVGDDAQLLPGMPARRMVGVKGHHLEMDAELLFEVHPPTTIRGGIDTTADLVKVRTRPTGLLAGRTITPGQASLTGEVLPRQVSKDDNELPAPGTAAVESPAGATMHTCDAMLGCVEVRHLTPRK